MIWAHAERNVTLVEDTHTRRDRTVVYLPRKSMRVFLFWGVYLSVAFALAACPEPAALSFIHVLPELNLWV
jgi:hypothetical protein